MHVRVVQMQDLSTFAMARPNYCCNASHSCWHCTPSEMRAERVSIGVHKEIVLPDGWPACPSWASLRLRYSHRAARGRSSLSTARATTPPLSSSYDPAYALKVGDLSPEPEMYASRWFVSHAHRLAVCPIEKNAATQWIALLWALNQKALRQDWSSLKHAWNLRELPVLPAYAPHLQQRIFDCASFVRLVVVRDPLERLMSAYRLHNIEPHQRRVASVHHAQHVVTGTRTSARTRRSREGRPWRPTRRRTSGRRSRTAPASSSGTRTIRARPRCTPPSCTTRPPASPRSSTS